MSRTLVALLSLLLAGPVAAQTTLGVRGGVNFATLGGDADGVGTRTGLNFGAVVIFPLSGNLGLQAGAHYSQKGAEESEGDVTATLEFDYIDIPVLLRYGFPSSGSTSFHLLAGPSISFNSGCNLSGSDGSQSASIDCDSADIDIASIDFGLMGGLGLDIQAGESLIITLDGLYNLGLSNLDDTETDSVKNRVWMIQAGLGFPLGG